MGKAMYMGGMILSSMEAAYEYEYALKDFIERRKQMFEGDTFWGRNRSLLRDFESEAHFPKDAYYYVPEDPLICFPDYEPVMLLKRRYLNRLRQWALKYHRRGGKTRTIDKWQSQKDFATEWIQFHIKQSEKREQ
jgi:hypothetical protein